MTNSKLSIIADTKRLADQQKNILQADDVVLANNEFITNELFKESILDDKPDIVKESKPVGEIGTTWLEDFYDQNLYEPRIFELTDLHFNDTNVIDMPSINDISENIYLGMIPCNFYANRDYEFTDLTECPPFAVQYDTYDQWYEANVGENLYNPFLVFTGLRKDNSPLGLAGQQALTDAFAINIENNAVQFVGDFVNLDPFRTGRTRGIFDVNYDITVPKTAVGKSVLFLEKLTGVYIPLSYLPDDVFGLDGKRAYDSDYYTDLVLQYTGAGQKKKMAELIRQNKYEAYIGDNLDRLQYYHGNSKEFDSEYDRQYFINQLFPDKTGKHIQLGQNLFGFTNPSYNVLSNGKYDGNPDMFSDTFHLTFNQDEFEGDIIWSQSFLSQFDDKTLMAKTKELTSLPSNFILSDQREYTENINGIDTVISKGDMVTASEAWAEEDGFQIKKGEFFRTFAKDRKYSKLSRTLRHRGLDNGDTRSVLNDNGLLNMAPTYRRRTDTTSKRYMFSLENLAWADNIADLPECEVGQGDPLTGHRGRMMWFPPYDLSFSEAVNVNLNTHSFIGRGENVYTYNNTERNGTLGFTVIMDYPLIVNKIRGQRTEFWERYFKGDKAVEARATELIRDRFNPAEIDEINQFIQLSNRKPKMADTLVQSQTAQNQQVIDTAVEDGLSNPGDIQFMKVYFPNDIDALPKTDNGLINNEGYQSDFQANFLDYTYYKGVKRDEVYFKKTKLIPYPNKTNYKLNNDFFSPKFIYDKIQEVKQGIADTKPTAVIVTAIGYASKATPVATTNFTLSLNRANNLLDWFKIEAQQNDMDVSLFDFKTQALSDTLAFGTGEEVDRGSRAAVAARRAELIVHFVTASGETVAPAAVAAPTPTVSQVIADDNLNQDINNLPSSASPLASLKSDLLNKLLDIGECDVFEYLETNEPFLQSTISEKIKYFHPAFHSMTPQGFNSRLTFLHQCTRQGRSVGMDGVDNLTNLAFGRPPVCILRVGDFFHTKIMINSLNIDYSSNGSSPTWDLNPEGAGVQPMTAKISINFHFIGGQTMSGPLNRLQNALSYNYYSNTEMFDPRADSLVLLDENGLKKQGGSGVSNVRVAEGFKLSSLLNKDELKQHETNMIDANKGQYGDYLPSQRVNPATAILATTAATNTSVSNTNDLIALKISLNLPLTENEKQLYASGILQVLPIL